ncbi:MAG: hypothetical protein U1F48_05600 [Burkholderiales bacterium]
MAAPITAGFEQWTERQTLSPAQMAELQALMASHATQSLAHLAAAKGDEQRFYALPAAAIGAYDLGRYEEARTLADELLAAVPRYTGNWNVGNAIHDGHMVLGLVALHAGDVAKAISELKSAGDTPGSPQLGSFGPSMQLAKALLEQGQMEPVLAYFGQCRRFWTSGSGWLDAWEATVSDKRVPNFMLHAYR